MIVQYDSVKDSGMRSANFVLRMLCESSISMEEVVLMFNRLTKAFDKVYNRYPLKVLEPINIDGKTYVFSKILL